MNYQSIVKNLTPKEKRLENAFIAFISGGLIGAMSESFRWQYRKN